MNRFFDKKNIAFTLAEMMVILTLFSVISAATLPVITAKNNMDMSEDSTSSGYFPDPWRENQGFLFYHNTGTPFENQSAVMVGGKVSEDAYALGYPELIVRENNFTVPDKGSQIVLSRVNGSNTYLGGRIMMKAPDTASIAYSGNIAIGNNALISNARNSIAVGAYAGYLNPFSSINNSVIMGQYYNGTVNNAVNYNSDVILGSNAGLATATTSTSSNITNSVFIGAYSQYSMYPSRSITASKNVVIGSYAGMGYANSNNQMHDSVNMGYYAGANSMAQNKTVTIGYYAGFHETYVESVGDVFIGSYAGAYSNIGSTSDSIKSKSRIAIGYESGYGSLSISSDSKPYDGNVSIGYNALKDANFSETYRGLSVIALGSHAGEHSSFIMNGKVNNSVFIGYRAGSYINSTNVNVSPSFVAIGPYTLNNTINVSTGSNEVQTVAIGPYAGYAQNFYDFQDNVYIGPYAGAFSGRKSGSTAGIAKTVCIGYNSCYGAAGSYDVRIAPKSPMTWTTFGGTSLSQLPIMHSYIGHGSIPSQFTSSDTTANSYLMDGEHANLMISPLSSDYTSADWSNSSIVLYADNVFGPNHTLTYSDKRLKENIKPLKYGLNEIRKINIYEYKLKDSSIKSPQIGVIAQELQEIIPESVHKFPEFLAVNSDWIKFALFNAVQELDKTLTSAQNEFKSYVKEYQSLASRVKTLEKEVKALESENKSLTNDINIAYRKAKKLEVNQ
ncbi:tail fiber domain-containing protein [bacterium]|nr:tail fiber domain-containing protein [bacterium]